MFEYLASRILLLSSLSTNEAILLKAELLRQLETKLNCDDRFREVAGRPGGEEIARNLKARCKVESKDARVTIDKVGYHKCLCQYQHPSGSTLVQLWSQYQKGILPFPGSYVDQPAYIIDAFNVIDYMHSEKQRADQEKAQRHHKKLK